MKTSKLRSCWAGQCTRLARLQTQWQAEELVFGKPDWFVKKKRGWGIMPTRLPGWIYTVAWSLVIAVPFVTLLMRHRAPEAAIWLLGSIGMLTWDVRKLTRAIDGRRSWSFHDE